MRSTLDTAEEDGMQGPKGAKKVWTEGCEGGEGGVESEPIKRKKAQ